MKDETKKNILKVVNGALSMTKIDMVPVLAIEKVLFGEGFEKTETHNDVDNNTGEVSFTYHFNHPKKGRCVLTGSLHLGGFRLFKKKDDEDD